MNLFAVNISLQVSTESHGVCQVSMTNVFIVHRSYNSSKKSKVLAEEIISQCQILGSHFPYLFTTEKFRHMYVVKINKHYTQITSLIEALKTSSF